MANTSKAQMKQPSTIAQKAVVRPRSRPSLEFTSLNALKTQKYRGYSRQDLK